MIATKPVASTGQQGSLPFTALGIIINNKNNNNNNFNNFNNNNNNKNTK